MSTKMGNESQKMERQVCLQKPKKVFRWIWIILESFINDQDGYVWGQGVIHYERRDECIKAAKERLKEHNDFDACTLTKGPYLIVETVDGKNNWY